MYEKVRKKTRVEIHQPLLNVSAITKSLESASRVLVLYYLILTFDNGVHKRELVCNPSESCIFRELSY